jgi:hypothetical protein
MSSKNSTFSACISPSAYPAYFAENDWVVEEISLSDSPTDSPSNNEEYFKGCEALGPRCMDDYEKIVTIVFSHPENKVEQTRHTLYYTGVEFLLHSDCVPEVTQRDSQEWFLVKLDEDQMLSEAKAISRVRDMLEIIKLRHIVQAIGIPFESVWLESDWDDYHMVNNMCHLDQSVLFMPANRTYFFETTHWFLSKTPAPVGAIQCRRETTLHSDIKYFAIPSNWM